MRTKLYQGSEITMYPQGAVWIVSELDERVQCNRVSGERTYESARRAVRDRRIARAAQLREA